MLTLEVSFNFTNLLWVISPLLFFFTILVYIYTFLFANCLYHYHIIVAGLAYTNAHFGSGTGSIVLDDVQCVSSDSQLLECSSRPILSHNCGHSDDAGVGCEGMVMQTSTALMISVYLIHNFYSSLFNGRHPTTWRWCSQ